MRGSPRKAAVRLTVLYTTAAEADWPDSLDPRTGLFTTYYGDNRSPGRELHDTQRSGNLLLRDIFERSHGDRGGPAVAYRLSCCSRGAAPGRRIMFRGLLAPGAATLTSDDDPGSTVSRGPNVPGSRDYWLIDQPRGTRPAS